MKTAGFLLLLCLPAWADPVEDLLEHRRLLARQSEVQQQQARTLAERDAALRPLQKFDMEFEAALRVQLELASQRALVAELRRSNNM
jgi:hypothetical protein